ncbi:MAG: glycosyltransferase [Bacteroidales bacterium]
MKITLLGPAYPYRGSFANLTKRLVEEFQKEDNIVNVYTFTLQYPNFLFPGESQYSESEAPKDIKIIRNVNSINPFNWIRVGLKLKKEKPDLVILRYWLPFFSPCFSTISRIARSNKHTKVIAIVDNIIPHEKRIFDNTFTRYFVGGVDGFLAMSNNVLRDISKFDTKKPRILTPHPLFDDFGDFVNKEEAQKKLGLSPKDINILTFGLIRKYKGVDILIEALGDERLKAFPIKLMVAGEFYDEPKPYYDRVKELGLESKVIFVPKFIPDEDVKYYFCSTDLIAQTYRSATQSGVTQIGYHFEKPMLVTDVGGLAEIIPNGKVGYVVEPNVKDIADAILDFCISCPDFSKGIKEEKKKYGWDNKVAAINKLYQETLDYDNKK